MFSTMLVEILNNSPSTKQNSKNIIFIFFAKPILAIEVRMSHCLQKFRGRLSFL